MEQVGEGAGDRLRPGYARRAGTAGAARSRRPGYATTMRISFSTPQRRAAVAAVGRTLPVLIDPAARDRIAIDTTRLD